MEGLCSKKMILGLCLFLILCFLPVNNTELQRFEHPVVKGDGSMSFLVIGDWGRRGEYNQSEVAAQN
ncbi:hypothetical protein SAY87_004463 [Trapa incisa]|uniref:Uncharacterized protein n=1 Tax=Trapa incisa TaxID=236973 RepID=A0AAN7JNV8_9MYRT|nr:hypothetical protein SAY87_004463 [Trapa incisa]